MLLGSVYVPSMGGTLYFGGTVNVSTAIDNTLYFLSDAGAWSTITTTGGPPQRRWGHFMFLDSVVANKVFCVAGYDSASGHTFYDATVASCWQLDITLATPAWADVTQGPGTPIPGVFSSGAVDPATGNAIYWVGQTVAGKTAANYMDNNQFWQVGAAGPSARNLVGAAWDSARSKFVIYGGENVAVTDGYADTWETSGLGAPYTWTDVSGSVGNAGKRISPYMAYAPAYGTILFGGATNPSTYAPAETWAYDGATWVKQAPAASPGQRFHGVMNWNSSLGRFQIFGGASPGGDLNEVWIYQ